METSDRSEPPSLVLKETHLGKGVFANRLFLKGEVILRFRGRLYRKEEYLKKVRHEKCHFLQIDTQWFLGPTRSIDNFVNHSCDPNCGYLVMDMQAFLVAIRNIMVGEEITFDYSTSMAEDFWEMNCSCGSPKCRGRIRDFKYLPRDIQDHYLGLRIVPDFVIRSLAEGKSGTYQNENLSLAAGIQ
ncbi:MAG: SET domain-containing protein-lysine N-methyltransferase [Leptospiraceae bacterium]|nr:SET domain-containing protein-lysine N-methyltransferase [Leptospiraceae bacterium]MDW8306552.1 SET domain-containing protein-lysine N-methyltransferase [Leptospiraceae bacterium]